MQTAIRRLFKEAGIQASWYSDRRTLATRLVENDVNILTIQSILGHSSPMTTLAYCEVTPEMQRRGLFG